MPLVSLGGTQLLVINTPTGNLVTAQVPDSIMPLAEVTNDHRMFFPFVGLSLAVFWSLRLLRFRKTARLAENRAVLRAGVGGLCLVLAAEAVGTHQRNEVWRTEESLWRDVTVKSPDNGRGLMNYGLTLMSYGDFARALSYYFERALRYTPDYGILQTNLGIANGGLHRDVEAERHFRRAIVLAPGTAEPHFYYGRWLRGAGRDSDARRELETAVEKNRLAFDARDLLMQMYSEEGDWEMLGRLAQETLQLAPADETARRFAAEAARREDTPERLVKLSLKYYQAGRYTECAAAAAAAKRALQLKPDFAEAYNNLAAAYNAMHLWEAGIRAAEEAIRLKPDFPLARNNLLWAKSHGGAKAARGR